MKQNYILELRDITQAYPQLLFELNRKIFAKLPKELRNKYPRNTIIQVIRPLYGIAESDIY
jgi:tRNA(Ile)-lysidine synthase TilS/MesJ